MYTQRVYSYNKPSRPDDSEGDTVRSVATRGAEMSVLVANRPLYWSTPCCIHLHSIEGTKHRGKLRRVHEAGSDLNGELK